MFSKCPGMKAAKTWALMTLLAAALPAFAGAGTVIQTAFATDSKERQTEKTVFDLETPKVYIIYMLVEAHKGDKVKINWIVEKAEGYKDNTVFDTAETSTQAGSFYGVFGYSKPKGGWPPGAYRADLLVDGKLEKSVKFRIGK